MRNLVLKFDIRLEEEDGNSHQLLARAFCNRMIDKEVREKYSHKDLMEIIGKEILFGSIWSEKDLLSKIKLPLNQDTKDLEERIKADLIELIPNYRFSLYFSDFSDNGYCLYSITTYPYNGETINITHPLSGEYLTTKYTGMRIKLDDGRWTYGYQSGCVYEGIIEELSPPFDEQILVDYFKKIGAEFKLGTERLYPLPIPKPKEERCDCYGPYCDCCGR